MTLWCMCLLCSCSMHTKLFVCWTITKENNLIKVVSLCLSSSFHVYVQYESNKMLEHEHLVRLWSLCVYMRSWSSSIDFEWVHRLSVLCAAENRNLNLFLSFRSSKNQNRFRSTKTVERCSISLDPVCCQKYMSKTTCEHLLCWCERVLTWYLY